MSNNFSFAELSKVYGYFTQNPVATCLLECIEHQLYDDQELFQGCDDYGLCLRWLYGNIQHLYERFIYIPRSIKGLDLYAPPTDVEVLEATIFTRKNYNKETLK